MTKKTQPSPSLTTLSRSASGTTRIDTRAIAWQASESPGFWTKLLFEDKATGETTWLMRFDPGAHGTAHAHDKIEEILVLEGSFFDDENSYLPGDYCLRAPGTMHAASSKDGCTMFVVYRPATVA
ncbi:MAG: cupin domain-containing protein [Dongiaceae bacterium]